MNCSLYFYNLPWCYYYLHVLFFSRFLESRNYKIQIVARVGRKSAVALSGIMEASYSHFFIGRGFESSTTRKRRARKSCPDKPPIASGVEESNSPRRALLLLLSSSSGGHYLKKKHVVVRTATWRSSSTSPKKVRKVGKTRSTI